jgi:hypothetical protein
MKNLQGPPFSSGAVLINILTRVGSQNHVLAALAHHHLNSQCSAIGKVMGTFHDAFDLGQEHSQLMLSKTGVCIGEQL